MIKQWYNDFPLYVFDEANRYAAASIRCEKSGHYNIARCHRDTATYLRRRAGDEARKPHFSHLRGGYTRS